LYGVTLKQGTVVAAGAVVTRDSEPYSVIAGVPAKKIAQRE
jgi:maltose O-acetyltransferase